MWDPFSPKDIDDALDRILLIYLCCLCAFIPFIWVLLPETHRRSLEEIGLLFGDRHVQIALDETGVNVEGITESSDKQASSHAVAVQHEYKQG